LNRLIFPEILRGNVTAFFTGKDPGAAVGEIAAMLGIQKGSIYLPIQRHTDKIVVLEASREPKIADAVITREKGILIGVQVADCVPILIWEKEKGVFAAVHAGWRGTAARILIKTVSGITERFAGRPENVLIAIGPSIKGCCYAVDHEVAEAVRKGTGGGDYCSEKGGEYFLDLPHANSLQAMSAGIPRANIWVSDECTFCNPGRFYSYRYSKGSTGRQAAFIGRLDREFLPR